MNWYIIILGAASLQGLLLAVAIQRINQNRYSISWLSALLIAISICLAGRIFYDSDLFAKHPKVAIASDLMLFTYGPLIFCYVRSIFFIDEAKTTRIVAHFLPAILHVLLLAQYLFRPDEQMFALLSTGLNQAIGQLTEVLGWIHISIYLVASYRLFRKYISDAKGIISNLPTINFLKYFFVLNGFALLLWATGYLLLKFNGSMGSVLFSYNSIWILLTGSVYMTGYNAIAIPDFFRIKLKNTTQDFKVKLQLTNQRLTSHHESHAVINQESAVNPSDDGTAKTLSSLTHPQVMDVVDRLKSLMESDRPFLDPNLTLPLLATKLGCTVHILSKAINDTFEKNFFDYVNEYRVNYFIHLTKQSSNRIYTLLSLAFESGFNSKSTFNSSFKKVTGKTPSQFLKGLSFSKSTN